MYKLVKRNSVISLLLSITEFKLNKNILKLNSKYNDDDLLITFFDKILTELNDDNLFKLFQYEYYTKIVCLYGNNIMNKITSSVLILTVTTNTDVKMLLNDITEFIDVDNGHKICKISQYNDKGYGPFYKENSYMIPSGNRYLLIFLNKNSKYSVNLNHDITVDNNSYILDGLITVIDKKSKYIKVVDQSYNTYDNRQNAVILLYRRQFIF